MGKPRLTKIERATKMINQGASTATIVKSLTVSPQYVYNLRSRLRNTGTIIKKKPEQLPLNFGVRAPMEEPIVPLVLPEPTQHLNTIQGEYSKAKDMTTWQRIKAAIGF
jgi:hypothetical protein